MHNKDRLTLELAAESGFPASHLVELRRLAAAQMRTEEASRLRRINVIILVEGMIYPYFLLPKRDRDWEREA